VERPRLRGEREQGIAVDWPVRYADLAPWYGHVERFIGVSGEKLGLAQLPTASSSRRWS
jgi:choline dehydrogenase-like flavoprotein